MNKKLAGYHRVSGSSDQKTDSGRFGEHPRCVLELVGLVQGKANH